MSENIYSLSGQLGDVDYQIEILLAKRNEIVSKISHLEEIDVMRRRGEMFKGMVAYGMSLNDPVHACGYVNATMLPWRHKLPQKYFESTLQVLMRSGGPSSFTRKQAVDFFYAVTLALDEDLASFLE